MRCRPSLRLRLGGGALLLALLSVSAAAVAIYGLARSQSLADEALAAQRRMEGYSAHAARVNDWMLGWLMLRNGGGVADAAEVEPNAAPVYATLATLDRLAAEDMAAATPGTEAELRLRTSLTPSRLRGFFQQLQRTLKQTPPGSPPGDAAIAFYAAQAPMIASRQIELDAHRRDRALEQMERLRQPLSLAAMAIALLSPLVLLALYLLSFRPLFARLSKASRHAEAMAQGHRPFDMAGHDELGLMFARLRQIGARLGRQRAGLRRDYAQLEGIVAERTAALTEANARLAQIDASRRRFFADVGHELRTPLTVILGEAELGAHHGDPAVVSAFETVRTRAERLFRRIEDLLRIARSESGQLELTQGVVRLDQVVALAASDLAPVLRRAQIRLVTDLPPLEVEGDADWLRQVFAGLLENAAKYAGRGAEVRICARIADRYVQVIYRDTGPGLPAGYEPFTRFARAGVGAAAAGSAAPAPGFGVGLALARWVVEASGGHLTLLPAAPAAEIGQSEAAAKTAALQGLGIEMLLPRGKEG